MKELKDMRIDHILSKQTEDRTAHLHVTDLFACPVGVWLQKKGKASQEINDSVQRRFDAGHNIEERLIEAVKHAKVYVSDQDRWSWPEFDMVGSSDVIIKEETGQLWLVEVKSCHVYAMDHIYRNNKPHAHYIDQVLLYLSEARKIYPNIKAMIYYESLDGRTAQFEVPYDPNRVTELFAQAKSLADHIENNTKPELLPDLIEENGKWAVTWQTKYCIKNGIHIQCDPNPLHTDPDKWVNKLTYQAKKRNDK